MEAPLSVLHSTLVSHLESQNESAEYTVSVLDERTDSNRVPDVMVLSIQTTMSSLPLEWQFLCSKSSPDKVTSSLWHEEHLVEIFV